MTARKPDAVGQMATWSLPAGLKAHATASRQRLQAKFMSCYSRDCCLQGCHLFSLCLGLHSSPSCQLVNYSIIHQIHLMSTTPSQTENAPVIELIQCVDFYHQLASDFIDICRQTTRLERLHAGLILAIKQIFSQTMGSPEGNGRKGTKLLCYLLHHYRWSSI